MDMTFASTEDEEHNIHLDVHVVFTNKDEFNRKLDAIISFFQHSICNW